MVESKEEQKVQFSQKGAAKVYCRIRPHGATGAHTIDKNEATDKQLIGWDNNTLQFKYLGREKEFTYPKKVLGPEVGQEQAFNEVGAELLDAFMEGYNCTLLAYGQTGTGKTHTMFGSPESLKTFSEGSINEAWGMFPRLAMMALNRMNEQTEHEFRFTCSCIDVYFGQFSDLLNNRNKCSYVQQLGEVQGYREVPINNSKDLCTLINTAASHRVQNATKCNDTSSRSHAIATLRLTRFNKADGTFQESTFVFGDLSGSERLSKTEQELHAHGTNAT